MAEAATSAASSADAQGQDAQQSYGGPGFFGLQSVATPYAKIGRAHV